MASNADGSAPDAPPPRRKCSCEGLNEHCSRCGGSGMLDPWWPHEVPEQPGYRPRPVPPAVQPPRPQGRPPNPRHVRARLPPNQVHPYPLRVRNVPSYIDPKALRTLFEKVGRVVSVTMHAIQGGRTTVTATVVMASPSLADSAARQLNQCTFWNRRLSVQVSPPSRQRKPRQAASSLPGEHLSPTNGGSPDRTKEPRTREANWKAAEAGLCRIAIENLPRRLTTTATVRHLLRPFGKVHKIALLKKRRTAFATVGARCASAATTALDGAQVGSHNISVRLLGNVSPPSGRQKKLQPKKSRMTRHADGETTPLERRGESAEPLDAKRHWNAFRDPSGGFGSYPSHDDYGEEGSS